MSLPINNFFVFFLMIRRPPRSPLFAYTPLFRSRQTISSPSPSPNRLAVWMTWQRQRARLDRKSTRLNSSHPVISYAVFCLEKNLETSGLVRDKAVTVEASLKNDDGSDLRPDVIINLPENRLFFF